MADELINKIYDVSAIQKEADQIAAIVKSTTDLISQVRGMKDFAGLSDASKKLNDNMVAGKKAVDDYSGAVSNLVKSEESLSKVRGRPTGGSGGGTPSGEYSKEAAVLKELEAQERRVQQTEVLLSTAKTEANKKTIENRAAIQAANQEIKNEIIVNSQAEGSILRIS